jgi:hypothetical protein
MLCITSFKADFLQVMAWSLIHSAWMDYFLAIFNAHDQTMLYPQLLSFYFLTAESRHLFHKAVQELQLNHYSISFASILYLHWCYVDVPTRCCIFHCYLLEPLFHRHIRMFLSGYVAAKSIIPFIGISHIGEGASLDHKTPYSFRLRCFSSFRSHASRILCRVLKFTSSMDFHLYNLRFHNHCSLLFRIRNL